LTWVWHYQPPFDSVVMGLKFRRLDYLAKRLAGPLAEQLDRTRFDVVVPVPLHWSRRLRRGYDQAELIAAELCDTLGRPLVRALRRRRATPAQSLHRDRQGRRANLDAAIVMRRRLGGQIRGLRVLLVDDVLTTGATLEAAARPLLDAGARSVDVAVAARTPSRAERRDGSVEEGSVGGSGYGSAP